MVKVSLVLALTLSLTAIERDYHGIQVDDPYAWLEEMKTPETQQWIAEQNEKANHYFTPSEERERLKEEISQYIPAEGFGIPVRKAKQLFYMMRREGDEKSVLCVEAPSGKRRVLVNPNATKSPSVLTGFKVSPNGKMVAYGLSNGGSDAQTWFVLHVKSGLNLPSKLSGIKFSGPEWSPNNKSIYYISWSEENNAHKVIRHDLFKRRDKKIYEIGNETDLIVRHPRIVQKGKYLLVSQRVSKNKGEGIGLIDVNKGSMMTLFPPGEGLSFIDEYDNRLLFITDRNAPNSKIVSVDLDDVQNPQTVIEEHPCRLLEVCCAKDYIVCSYLENCCAKLVIFDYAGNFIRNVPLPGMGTITMPAKGGDLSSESGSNEVFFPYTDFFSPSTIYRTDCSESEVTPLFQSSVSKANSYVIEQKFFASKDGTPIPLFIVHKKGVILDQPHPTLMYGYGGFNLSITPWYSPLAMQWLDSGGIYVSVNIRGGGEYGTGWYEEGIVHQKQNSYDDFISAGEWLIEKGYTTPTKLAITGRSNGGLLVGACFVQRPDLFGAAIPQVGVFDMLRFHKFTIGYAWKCDYGDPDDPEDFPYIYAYSPYHNLKKGVKYPPTLITTADCDDRVVPLHSYKFAARLQEVQDDDVTSMLRVYTSSGHSAGITKQHAIEECADILTFLKNELE